MDISNNIFIWSNCNKCQQKKLLERPSIFISKNISTRVHKIIDNVKKNGDSALRYYNNHFDKVIIKNLIVSNKKILQSSKYLSVEFKHAMSVAFKNIKKFHLAQKLVDIDIETQEGIRCQQINRPIFSVGLYIPGGSYPLFSTVLMLAIPAIVAGCKKIIICSPPPISYEIIYAANICNITKIFQIGGAQAIAALAFGTKSVPKVDKIFGPGNTWVTEAKRQVSNRLNGSTIDMLAGPSELVIIADKTANPDFIASDLLSQAEHGTDSQVILLTTSAILAKQVFISLNKQLISLTRSHIIKQSLNNSRIIITNNLQKCVDISNIYGPEHLIIKTKKSRELLNKITNAGSVFIGDWSPESVGDYASGTNHVLPTYGYTKTHSGIGTADFQKRITIQELTINGFINLSSTIKILAKSENMIAHENAITVRLNNYRKNKYEIN